MSLPIESADILIAGGDPAENGRLAAVLRAFGYTEIRTAGNLDELRNLHAHAPADALVVEVGGAAFDGLAAIKAVAGAEGQPPQPVVLALASSDRDPDLYRRALSLGARDILRHPFGEAEFRARIRGLIELHLLRRTVASHSRSLEDAVRSRVAQMTQTLAEAEKANRAKSDFLARMSHDIRTPLNAILGFSEILAKEMFGPLGNKKYKDYAATIHGAVLQAVGLTSDLMDLGRIEQDKLEIDLRPTNVKKLIAESVEIFRDQAEKAKVVLKVDIQADFPALRTDERRFKQIVFNLLSNAIKFTPAGRGVTVKAWNDPSEGCFVVVFSDAGIGIAPEDLELVMQPYGQAQMARSTGGVGLGLPITKRLVELLGGSLELRSKVGIGTSVKLCFPTDLIVHGAENAT